MNHAEKVKQFAAKACMDRFYAQPPMVVIDSQRIFEAAVDEMQAEIDRLRYSLLTAHAHIDMAALRVSHCKDAELLGDAFARAISFLHPEPQARGEYTLMPKLDEIYLAWHAVGADVAGLSWGNFVAALKNESQARGDKT